MLPKPPLLKAVLLDAGNTLIFLDHAVLSSVATRGGLQLPPETLRAAEAAAKRAYEALLKRGGSHDDGWMVFMEHVFEHAGAPLDRCRGLAEGAWHEHLRFNLWCRVPEGLTTALERLRAHGVRVGVVSNAEGVVDQQLARAGLAPYLDIIVDSGLERVRKPDPEIFRRALSRLQLGPGEVLYAGDIPEVDVGGARAAGLAAVLVDPFDHYPDFTEAPRVPSVAALVDLLL